LFGSKIIIGLIILLLLGASDGLYFLAAFIIVYPGFIILGTISAVAGILCFTLIVPYTILKLLKQREQYNRSLK